MLHPCKFSINGCLVKKLLPEILLHEEACDYEKIKCFMCGKYVTIFQFKWHNNMCVEQPNVGNIMMDRLHLTDRLEDWDGVSPVVFKGRDGGFTLSAMFWDGVVFYIRVIRRHNDKRFVFIAALEGSTEDCQKYTVTYSLENPNTDEMEVVSTSGVVPLKDIFDLEMVENPGVVGSVGDRVVQKYLCKQNGEVELRLRYEIRKW